MNKVALVTGSAKRIGKVIVDTLHGEGMNVVIHYHHSQKEAEQLCFELNKRRAQSAIAFSADIRQAKACQALIESCLSFKGRLDLLVNNASSFYKTPIGEISDDEWEDLIGVI